MPKTSVSELVAQLPDTDLEVRERTPLPEDPSAAEKERKRRAAEDRWGKASKFTGPDPSLADQLARGIFEGGRKSIRELLALVRDPSLVDYKDYKAEYLLHILAVNAGYPGKDKERKLLTSALLAAAEDRETSLYTQSVILRELQWVGDSEAIKALGRLLVDESVCEQAAAALVAIGGPAVIEQFRKAFKNARGVCRLTAAQHLGTFRDSTSVEPLHDVIFAPDDQLSLVAVWALARIADPRSINHILKFASDSSGYRRVKATQYCVLMAENLSALGRPAEAMQIYTYLQQTRKAPEDQYLQELLARRISNPV